MLCFILISVEIEACEGFECVYDRLIMCCESYVCALTSLTIGYDVSVI